MVVSLFLIDHDFVALPVSREKSKLNGNSPLKSYKKKLVAQPSTFVVLSQ